MGATDERDLDRLWRGRSRRAAASVRCNMGSLCRCRCGCRTAAWPVVTVGTGPPDFAFAAVADAVGSEWRVARAVPLGEKILALVAMAIF
mgnify:CR=1 FL=1